MKFKVKVTEKNAKKNLEKFLSKVRDEVKTNIDEIQDSLFWSIMGIAGWISPKPIYEPEFRYIYNKYLDYLRDQNVQFYYKSGGGFGVGWLTVTGLDDATRANYPVDVAVQMYKDKEIRTLTYAPERIVPYWRLLEWGQYLEKEKNLSPNPKGESPRHTEVWYLPVGEIISGPASGKPFTYFTYNVRENWDSSIVPPYEVLKKLWSKTYPDFRQLVRQAILKNLPQTKGG